MKKLFILTISFVSLLSVSSDLQKKMIRQDGYDINCNVYLKPLKTYDITREYYWFKSSEIHSSLGSAGGLVLHDEFEKYYRSNQLAEKGEFDYGLKQGLWIEWYDSGQLKSTTEWNQGLKHGAYVLYNKKGHQIITGSYKRNDSVNKWINHITKDTTYFQKGEALTEKPVTLWQRVFKQRDSLEKLKRKQDRVKRKQERKQKETWIKRLFKKDSTQNGKKG
jgi:antitoxin component YwqK of YwqJK toxin-antitoxin module